MAKAKSKPKTKGPDPLNSASAPGTFGAQLDMIVKHCVEYAGLEPSTFFKFRQVAMLTVDQSDELLALCLSNAARKEFPKEGTEQHELLMIFTKFTYAAMGVATGLKIAERIKAAAAE